MRQHKIPGWSSALPAALPPQPSIEDGGSQPTARERSVATDASAIPLQHLLASLRQHVRGDHVVDASVLSVEATTRDGFVLLLGEAEPASRSEPPRLEAHLSEDRRATIEAELGRPFDPLHLANRKVQVGLRTSLKQRFGRGATVQAKVIGLYAISEFPIELEIQREEVLRWLRADGVRFGPATWRDPEELHHVALIASEHGDALRDVDHVLKPLEASGLIVLHRLKASFEGPSAERSLVAAMAEAEALHVEHGLSATLVARGGGPASSFSPLNAWATAAAARRLPNLVVGVGHAATPRTVLDDVAGRSVPTPTAAAMLIRDLLRGTALRAEQALAALEEAMREDIQAEARRALARVMAGFDEAVRICVSNAEQQLLKVGLTVERSLLASIASRSSVMVASDMTAGGVGDEPPLDFDEAHDPLTEAALAIVIEAETGRIIQSAADARRVNRLILQFTDGLVGVGVCNQSTSNTAH
ncbi:exodeoxyribonuclease VII large subunit [Methylobacterium bullatum]|uniref:Exodeoxyribonuclease 7 large subunit n=1 Tax=Methylobacterium bullatum TaxID=570505 RepID=A0AAV4ZC38_9HYPH|nr:exodeoxyribonuclease VII large subunit [Methylobacterium bullatum]MBD8902326.1 exonuclease VII large subunit [Methylobacterium bullatum]GJD41367.1 Exodeoxyribonuclease 7 large subunit [Methylobacterium bullatum]